MSQEETNNQTEEDTSTHLLITAFGPFGGVDENPSMILLRELPEALDQPGWKQEVKDRIYATHVIETSAIGVHEALRQLEPLCKEKKKMIALHLGVNVYGTGYHLEECGYNDASFRIPDQRNFQPQMQPIVSENPLGDPCRTTCNIPELAEHMARAFPAIESKCSIDPGRFVCNYLYYSSLQQLQGKATDSSFFLHIPPFEKVPKEVQMEYLAELLRMLVQVELR